MGRRKDDNTDKLQVRIHRELIEFMNQECKDRHMSRSAFISVCIEKALAGSWADFQARRLAQIGVAIPKGGVN